MRILLWLCGCLLAWSVSGKELYINFSDYAVGTTPTNFHSVLAGDGAPGTWKIVSAVVPSMFSPQSVRDNTAPRGVLAQTATDFTDEHFPMFIYDGGIFRDFKIAVRFETVSGISEQMAGVVFRFQNTSNFYIVRVSSLGQNVRFYKVVNGIRSNPIGPALNIPVGTWHTLGIQCEGNRISIFLDDHPVMPTLSDNDFKEGQVGFWTKSDAVSYFADAMIDYTPTIAAAQAMVEGVTSKEARLLGLRIYTLQTNNTTRIIASKAPEEIGRPGTAAEIAAITNGVISYGTEPDAVLVTMPLRDRNGEYIAAMRVKMKSYITESQDAAVMRATVVRNKLEQLCTSADDLGK